MAVGSLGIAIMIAFATFYKLVEEFANLEVVAFSTCARRPEVLEVYTHFNYQTFIEVLTLAFTTKVSVANLGKSRL